ncbi:methylmalonyl-CoA epimerase [Rubripirellula reticaptiva]|uniref:Glyoxalase/Bleomycin resistance protein/Dioxygenase superfamily protein n=1 Tax=Rubripirellula reticaptiva TaxID=2528013 RepID=A0A5C6F9R6_9BACT|nr:methylmalonyl-CoA epimerase [Rubripirellula reticaptiva]TWU57197.1 Glyoxalase/Bleomycin resistance protein/Dioxygenase superfamily protein [Rubripirellula reticaptiva]
MIVALDHIAIAVPSLDKAIERFVRDLGLSCESTDEVADQSVALAMFPLPSTKIELLQATADESAIGKFVRKRGGGIHHLCFLSDDLDNDIARLRSRGYQFLSDHPFIGAGGHRVIFIHPDSFDGVLIELASLGD